MKITIDTKHDTHEDIRKVLHILTHILENKESSSRLDSNINLSTATTEEKPAGFMNMFGDSPTPTSAPSNEPNQTEPETAPDFSNFMNLMNKKEDDNEDKEEPKLEFF
jgi:hypothetical protein